MTLIAQFTDIHLRPAGQPCYRVSETNMLAERAIETLASLSPRPDAYIFTGDLTDTSDPREYALARRLLGRLEAPVFVIPGNHDRSVDVQNELSEFPGVHQSGTEKVYYSVTIGDLRLIGLDSSIPDQPHGEIGKQQLNWLSDELAKSDKPTLIALHHPPMLTGIKHMDEIGLKDSEALAEVVGPHDCIKRLICGHVHRPIVAEFARKIVTLAPSTAHQVQLDLSEESPAMFTMEPPAFYLHRYTDKTGVITHQAYVESYPGPYPFFFD